MATIYYCQICEVLLVDEDELPTVGVYCSRRCEKLFDKYGLEGGRKEYKKKGKIDEPVNNVPVRNLPAESIPENRESNKKTLRKKMSNISILSNRDDDNDRIVVNQTKPSFLTFFGKNKNKDNSDNETPPDDEKKKNESKHVSKDYEDSLEYFRKQSEIEHALRREDNNNISINKKRKDNKKRNDSDDDDNTPIITFRDSNNSNEHLNTPPPSRPKNQRNTPSPSRSENQRDTPPPSRPEDQRTTTSSPNIPLYPELRVINKSPLDDLDDLYDHSEPPPSYDALFPDPPKIVKVDEKSLPPPPIEKKTIDTDIKKKPIFTDTKKKPITGTTHKETKLAIPPIPPKVNPLIPPKVPPKIPIPTARRDIISPQPPHNSSQQPHNNTPSNIFLQEQASLPSSVYPPPFYVNRYNNNQS